MAGGETSSFLRAHLRGISLLLLSKMRSRDLPRLSKQGVSILSQNLRGQKITGKEAEIILRIKERRLFAATFQKTWKAGSEVRENEGITFLEHGLAMKVCPCGSQGVAIALGPEDRKAWERAGSLRLTFGSRILATRLTIMGQHKRPVSLLLVSAYAPDTSQSPEERGKNPQFREKKLPTAQRPRTYTHPTRPLKLLGLPHAYPQPTHRAGPYGLRCALPSCSPGE